MKHSVLKGTYLWVGMKQLNCKIPKDYQAGNFYSQLLQPRETFASARMEATIKEKALGL